MWFLLQHLLTQVFVLIMWFLLQHLLTQVFVLIMWFLLQHPLAEVFVLTTWFLLCTAPPDPSICSDHVVSTVYSTP